MLNAEHQSSIRQKIIDQKDQEIGQLNEAVRKQQSVCQCLQEKYDNLFQLHSCSHFDKQVQADDDSADRAETYARQLESTQNTIKRQADTIEQLKQQTSELDQRV